LDARNLHELEVERMAKKCLLLLKKNIMAMSGDWHGSGPARMQAAGPNYCSAAQQLSAAGM